MELRDTGCWILDVGCKTEDVRCRMDEWDGRMIDSWLYSLSLTAYALRLAPYAFVRWMGRFSNLRKSACPVEFPTARDYSSGAKSVDEFSTYLFKSHICASFMP